MWLDRASKLFELQVLCVREKFCPLGRWGCTMGFHVKLGIASFLERLQGERISIAKKFI
jgi:hypothetical protein